MVGGVTFYHPNVNPTTLTLRFAPIEVDWTYNLITSETNTYAGQVVQLLSVNFENFIIQGQFGKDSRADYERQGPAWMRKSPPSVVASNFGPGLTQMTEWFKAYFAVASQGIPGQTNYSQQPMTITYQGQTIPGQQDNIPVDLGKTETWKVYPINFPSYRIANDNFAPEWRVECQVYEAPEDLRNQTIAAAEQEAIARLEYQPLYEPGSTWSDPYPQFDNPNASAAQLKNAALQALQAVQQEADLFSANLPAYTPSEIDEIIARGFSHTLVYVTPTPPSGPSGSTPVTPSSGYVGVNNEGGGNTPGGAPRGPGAQIG